jgi:hypothetical protein
MIVDYAHDIDTILQCAHTEKTLIVPIFSNPTEHVSIQKICALYVYCESDSEWIIPMRHTEQIRGFTERLGEFLQLDNIFIHDKKQWIQTGGNANVWDVKTLWWYTYSEAYDESHYPTATHQFYWRRHKSMIHVNALIPLQKHLEMCQKIRHYAWPMCANAELSESYIQFNSVYPEVFAKIEQSGLCVTNTFRMPDLIHKDHVYSNYNYHTTTGRPSNAFRGFNYAAMNKDDGTRAAFCSRFEQGALVEMDFDSYHVRLIARLVGYELPATSVHDYLGRFYFGVDALTAEQREESKAITFRLLYGGIDREFLTIPFFNKVNDFIYSLWGKWKQRGCVETPIIKRKLCKDTLQNMTANKLFNYYLQAMETEVSVKKLQQLLELLTPYQSKIVLYTYDSILLDVDYTEAKQLLPAIKNTLEQGNFPIKSKVGDIYDKMNDILL